ncbi:MAG: hypothetical protein K2G90_08085 [Muribaculaceae bacterium]|nr:hypothetical protein [Muribaculaceae bacterium]
MAATLRMKKQKILMYEEILGVITYYLKAKLRKIFDNTNGIYRTYMATTIRNRKTNDDLEKPYGMAKQFEIT